MGNRGMAAPERLISSAEPRKGVTSMHKIPSTQEQIPAIGLGTWQTFDVSGEAAMNLEPLLREFVALGGSLVDSSPMYGKAEEVVGELASRANLNDKLFMATKVWTSGRERGIEQMQASMRKLKRSKIELMQVHNLVDVDRHLSTLNAWKNEGRVRYVGVTHYTASAYGDVEAVLRRNKVDFLQINYSALEREAERTLLPLAHDLGVAVIANRPFAEGALLRRLASKPLPSFAGELQCTSWAQLLLKFVISHAAVSCAIPATSKLKHLRDNMGAGSGPMPDASLRKRIADAVA
jgi:diketogulonate reductase-like aldo/keto reductase